MWAQDLLGKQFNRLTVINRSEPSRNKCGYALWVCECICGKLTIVTSSRLRKGTTKSCGCLVKDQSPINGKLSRTTHGYSRHPSGTYGVWAHMKDRCLNPNCEKFKDYGGRGITICKRWLKFQNFLKDMGEKPKGLSIDRINNDGNYNKRNCRWATPKQQQNNTRLSKRKCLTKKL
jgi:hypothetical protein